MPLLHGTITFSRFRVEAQQEIPKDVKKWLQRGLTAKKFEPIDLKGEEDRAAGFVELEDSDQTEFSAGALFAQDYALFAFKVQQLRIPGSILREEVDKWSKAFEKEKKRPPNRPEKAEARENAKKSLRSRVIPSVKVYDVSWSLKGSALQIWASSKKQVEEIQTVLEDQLKLKLVPLRVGSGKITDVESLRPTPELFGEEVAGLEVNHGNA